MHRGSWFGLFLVLVGCGGVQPAATPRSAPPPAAKGSTEREASDALEDRWPCVKQLRTQRVLTPSAKPAPAPNIAATEPRISLSGLRLQEVILPRQAARQAVEVELHLFPEKRGQETIKPELPWPEAAIEAGLPEELRSVWRAAVGRPGPVSQELSELAKAAKARVALCSAERCTEDMSCYQSVSREIEERAREHPHASQSDLTNQLIAGLERFPRHTALRLAVALQGNFDRVRLRNLLAAVVQQTRPDETLGFHARYLAADSLSDATDALPAFRELTKHATGFEAYAAWFRVAMLEAAAPKQAEALGKAIAALPTDGAGNAAARETAHAFLLRVLLAQGKHAERLRLARAMLDAGVSGNAATEAAFHVADALLLHAPRDAVTLPRPAFDAVMSAVLESAVARRDRRTAERALALTKQHASDHETVAHAQRKVSSLAAEAVNDDEAASDRAYALSQDCMRAHGSVEGTFKLLVRPAAGLLRVQAEPRTSAFGRCLAERAPHFLADLNRPVHAKFTTEAPSDTATVAFVVLAATRRFAIAEQTLARMERKLGLRVDTRDLKPDGKGSLTFPEAICAREGGYPCYVARGRFDDGAYLSIEASAAYDGFAPGYYLVVAASGDPASPDIRSTLELAQRAGVAAYRKASKVYIGCMH